jgi:hypothetical protein
MMMVVVALVPVPAVMATSIGIGDRCRGQGQGGGDKDGGEFFHGVPLGYRVPITRITSEKAIRRPAFVSNCFRRNDF